MSSLRKLVAWSVLACLAGPAVAAGVVGMPAPEIEALQRRLADAKCYAGPIDGRPQRRPDAGDCRLPVAGPAVAHRDRHACGDHLPASASTGRAGLRPRGRTTRRCGSGRCRKGGCCARCGCRSVPATAARSPPRRFRPTGGSWRPAAGTRSSQHRPDIRVYIFDVATGALVARAGSLRDLITHLAFSPDGRWLAVTLGGGQGCGVLDTTTWTLVAADDDLWRASYGAAFGPDGRLYTVALDGKLRRYGPAPAFLKDGEAVTRGGQHPYSVAVDPAARCSRSASTIRPQVDLYDAATLRLPLCGRHQGLEMAADQRRLAWRRRPVRRRWALSGCGIRPL